MKIGFLTGVFLFLGGCASVINGSKEKITINSEPAGAKVIIDDKYIGKAPVIFEAERRKDLAVRLKKDGYNDTSIIIENKFSDLALLDLLIPPFFLIDLYTGGAWTLEKDRYFIELDSEKANQSYNIKMQSNSLLEDLNKAYKRNNE